MTWQLAEAKTRFSEVVTRALTAGPQRIRRRDQVVVLAEAEYERLTGAQPTLAEYLLAGPDPSDSTSSATRARCGTSRGEGPARHPRPHPGVALGPPQLGEGAGGEQDPARLSPSVVTLGELATGIAPLADGRRKRELAT